MTTSLQVPAASIPSSVAVAFCCDDRMEIPLHVACSSLARHLRPGVTPHFYLMLTGFTPAMQDLLRKTLDATSRPWEITFIPDQGSEMFRRFRALQGSHANYNRLRLGQFIDAARYLYLDTDTLPMIDVAPLFGVDMEGHIAGFVVDGVIKGDIQNALYMELGMAPDKPMFNSGVMLVQTRLWNEDKCFERALSILNEYAARLKTRDQTALNIMFADGCFHLPHEFNRKVFPEIGRPLRGEPAIYHLLGIPKPWDLGSGLLLNSSRLWYPALHRTALPAARKQMWLQKASWTRLPRLLGGYKRAFQSIFRHSR